MRAAPDREAQVARRTRNYALLVRAVDLEVARCMRSIPPAQRKLVTDHDAFGYFAARYGLEVVGTVIPARTTLAQPSAGELARLADTIERERVRAVFPESSVSADVARAIARQTGADASHVLYARHARPGRLTGGELRRDAGRQRRLDRARADGRAMPGGMNAARGDGPGRRLQRDAGAARRHLRGRARDPRSACWAPTAAARRRSSGCCCGELRASRRDGRARTAAAAPSPRPSARGSTIRSARSTWR